jgi:hypothetical protein
MQNLVHVDVALQRVFLWLHVPLFCCFEVTPLPYIERQKEVNVIQKTFLIALLGDFLLFTILAYK